MFVFCRNFIVVDLNCLFFRIGYTTLHSLHKTLVDTMWQYLSVDCLLMGYHVFFKIFGSCNSGFIFTIDRTGSIFWKPEIQSDKDLPKSEIDSIPKRLLFAFFRLLFLLIFFHFFLARSHLATSSTSCC